jgi:peptidase M28-like protein
MELACVMARYEFDATLVFMAVAGEEQGLLGSSGWAKAAKAKGLDVAGMFTNDIVGNTRRADGKVDRGRVRLFAEGVPPLKALPDEIVAALRTGGENDLPTRSLARYVKEVAERHVPQLKVDVIYRRDRYLRGGDHFPFLDAGYAALRFTEPVEDFRHQHQDVRVVNGVQFGDLPEFVDFGYVADVARVNAAALASLALGPSAPKDVEMMSLFLENNTTLRWKPNAEPDVAGYRILWRETTAPFWQHAYDAGNATHHTLVDVSKDNFVFGVQAYDRDGNLSVTTYPRPFRR